MSNHVRLCLLAVLLFPWSVRSQDSTYVRDAIILNDGTTFIGTILHQTHPDTVLFFTKDHETYSIPRNKIATITKETVVRGYVQPSQQISSKVIILPGYGRSFTKGYGTGFGFRTGYLHSSRFYFGAAADSYSDKQVISAETQIRGPMEDESRVMTVQACVGREFARGDWSAIPYAGFGVASLTSKVTYVDKNSGQLMTYLEDKAQTTIILLGLQVSWSAFAPVAIGIDVRQQLTLGGMKPASQVQPLTKRDDNQLSIFLLAGVFF